MTGPLLTKHSVYVVLCQVVVRLFHEPIKFQWDETEATPTRTGKKKKKKKSRNKNEINFLGIRNFLSSRRL